MLIIVIIRSTEGIMTIIIIIYTEYSMRYTYIKQTHARAFTGYKDIDKEPRLRLGFFISVFISLKHDGEVCIMFENRGSARVNQVHKPLFQVLLKAQEQLFFDSYISSPQVSL